MKPAAFKRMRRLKMRAQTAGALRQELDEMSAVLEREELAQQDQTRGLGAGAHAKQQERQDPVQESCQRRTKPSASVAQIRREACKSRRAMCKVGQQTNSPRLPDTYYETTADLLLSPCSEQVRLYTMLGIEELSVLATPEVASMLPEAVPVDLQGSAGTSPVGISRKSSLVTLQETAEETAT